MMRSVRGVRLAVKVFWVVCAGGLLGAAPANAATAAFGYTGIQQVFTVPAGVTQVRVIAVGGAGAGSPSVRGGRAALVSGDLKVAPGLALSVRVGGNGAAGGGGYNGGGASAAGFGGGGASSVHVCATGAAPTCPLVGSGLLLVAAGGGGAGAPGALGATTAGTVGGDAEANGGSAPDGGGGAGTASGGGAGGPGVFRSGCVGMSGAAGAPGSAFAGGAGGSTPSNDGGDGGGGGGGLFGGGGGGEGFAGTCGGILGSTGGTGGGGGSSLVPAGGSRAIDTRGTPAVLISYTAADETAPVISRLSLTRRTFQLGSRLPKLLGSSRTGTTIRLTLSEAARLTFSFERPTVGRRVGGRCRATTRQNANRRRCERWVPVRGRSFSLAGRAGRNRVRFQGRTRRTRRLRPGRYRLVARAKDPAGILSKRKRVRFRLLPRR